MYLCWGDNPAFPLPEKVNSSKNCTYGGQNAVGVTLRHTSESGNWSLDGGVTSSSYSTGGQIGISTLLPF